MSDLIFLESLKYNIVSHNVLNSIFSSIDPYSVCATSTIDVCRHGNLQTRSAYILCDLKSCHSKAFRAALTN